VDSAAREAGVPAEQAAITKISEYSVLPQSHLFKPIAVENTGFLTALPLTYSMSLASVHSAAKNAKVFFFSNAFLYYRPIVQRFNAIILYNCFVRDDPDL